MKYFFIILICCSSGLTAMAQSYGSFAPAERLLLDLLSADSTHPVNAVLQSSYRFGIRDMTFDRISILKTGRRILLLPDGQDAVFEWRRDLRRLVRIDSSRFSGSNFGMMPFIRNGQAWQFGGYGFWQSRKIFTRFDEEAARWQLEYSDPLISGHQTIYVYDPHEDAFYMYGSYRNRPHDMHRTDFMDSVYRFDFKDRRWIVLGKISVNAEYTDYTNALHLIELAMTDSGAVRVMGSQSMWYDFSGNRLCRIRLGADTALVRVANMSRLYDKQWEQSVMIGDTMHVIHATKDVAVLNHFFLSASMFEPIGSIWDVGAHQNASEDIGVPLRWILLGMLSFVAIWLINRRLVSILRSRLFSYANRRDGHVRKSIPVEDWMLFWNGIRPPHQALLRYLTAEKAAKDGVDVEMVNHILGLSKRPPSLQKAHRNRAIFSINQVYRQTFRRKDSLVDRLKDPEDRRQIRFHISEVKRQLIRNYIPDSSNPSHRSSDDPVQGPVKKI